MAKSNGGLILLGLLAAGGVAYAMSAKATPAPAPAPGPAPGPASSPMPPTCQLDSTIPAQYQAQLMALLNQPLDRATSTLLLSTAQQLDTAGFPQAATCLRARAAQFGPATPVGPVAPTPTPIFPNASQVYTPGYSSQTYTPQSPAPVYTPAPYSSQTYTPPGV